MLSAEPSMSRRGGGGGRDEEEELMGGGVRVLEKTPSYSQAVYDDKLEPSPLQKRLRWFVGLTATLHLAGYIATIAIRKDQLVPLTKGYVMWPVKGTVNGKFSFGSESATNLSMANLIASFFLLSFGFQMLTIVNLPGDLRIRKMRIRVRIWDTYIRKLTTQGIQPYRWIEYSFSASCLFLLGSLINGVYDLYHVLLIFAGIWTVMMLGLVQELVAFYLRKLEAASIGINEATVKSMEIVNQGAKDNKLLQLNNFLLNLQATARSKRNIIEFFMPHLIGWVLYLFLWGEQLDRFRLDLKHSPSKPPDWVYGFYIVNFIIFSSFGFNQFAQMVRLYKLRADDDRRLRDIALQHEFFYVFLSLSAKSLSGYFLLSGMLASSSAASY